MIKSCHLLFVPPCFSCFCYCHSQHFNCYLQRNKQTNMAKINIATFGVVVSLLTYVLYMMMVWAVLPSLILLHHDFDQSKVDYWNTLPVSDNWKIYRWHFAHVLILLRTLALPIAGMSIIFFATLEYRRNEKNNDFFDGLSLLSQIPFFYLIPGIQILANLFWFIMIFIELGNIVTFGIIYGDCQNQLLCAKETASGVWPNLTFRWMFWTSVVGLLMFLLKIILYFVFTFFTTRDKLEADKESSYAYQSLIAANPKLRNRKEVKFV